MIRTRIVAVTAAVAVLGAGTAVASGALAGAPSVPPVKPLATAVHDALAAPEVQGVQARVRFTNRLVDSSSLGVGSPLLSGAEGRLWLAADGRARLELQSDQGDAQIVFDGKRVTVFDAGSNTGYVVKLPPAPAEKPAAADAGKPTLTRIQRGLEQLMRVASVTGPTGTNVAGREAYSVRVAPKHDGGLLAAGALAFDAANGTPLRVGVYATDRKDPVLELAATDISFGPIAASAVDVPLPAGAKLQTIDLGAPGAGRGRAGGDAGDVTGAKAVAAALPFTLSAPETLGGLPRHQVRLVDLGEGGTKGALVTYGQHLGSIVVLEQPADGKQRVAPAEKAGDGRGLQLPKVSINGADGQELVTTLGTVVRFERGGVAYTVLGSVSPAAAEAAARGL